MNEKNDIRKNMIDRLYEAMTMIAEGCYVYVCDIKYDYSRWSERAVDYFGLPGKYMVNAGGIWAGHIHEDNKEVYNKQIESIFAGSGSGHDMQYRARRADGEYVVCTCKGTVLRDNDGNPDFFVGSIKNNESVGTVDTLTGLKNLYGFFEDLKGIFWQRKWSTIMLVGITGFSDINDVYGYSFGNRVLQSLGRYLEGVFAGRGNVYRMDGTKYAVLTSEMTLLELEQLYKMLRDKHTHDFYVDGKHLSLSLNAGAIVLDNFEITKETAYSCLRYSYYRSKLKKLGELVVFEDTLSDENRQTVEKINVIRNSITQNCSGFYLCYQPIMDAKNETLKGFEALVRWRNEEYGSVPPMQFIPILEQDSLFNELGTWILRTAMIDGLDLLKRYPGIIINVNLSYTQIEKHDFVNEVMSLLKETGFPPENLCLEITERCRLLDTELLKKMFGALRANGIKVALDDFGTGFSSIGVLRELPVDTVKIDREFVKNIENSESDQNTVEFISGLANAFAAEVCVEGVETESMRDFLRHFLVNSFQGYLYSKPVTKEEIFNK
ncbi:EAL domain-containing protein [Ruminococcus sp. NK3A76]|uniref:bifunctional diguanylate cyclase/phosphodiesterase n=1 Tax=Ruminococcus sp. NK3A76 TaxID=877411 RepID=UPI00048A9120|nr:EAL domain-containing protein [Ruminococcus sp. NK3A76]